MNLQSFSRLLDPDAPVFVQVQSIIDLKTQVICESQRPLKETRPPPLSSCLFLPVLTWNSLSLHLPFFQSSLLCSSSGRWRFVKKKGAELLLEAKRIQGPRQLINVLLVSHQVKSTFLEVHRYSSTLFERCPARPLKYSDCVSYLLF